MGARIPLISDKAAFVDPRTGQLTVEARNLLTQILNGLAASVTGPMTSVVGNTAKWNSTDGTVLKD